MCILYPLLKCFIIKDIIMIETDKRYWDCECREHYIHKKEDRKVCPICYCREEDMPDSRVDEIDKKENLFNEG